MQTITKVFVQESALSWRILAEDKQGRHPLQDLEVVIYPYDLRSKSLDLAKERACILAYEHNLQEIFIVRLSGKREERIELEYSMLVFASHMQLLQTDQAEMLLSGRLLRFSGWNGLRFERYQVIASQEYSLACSLIYQKIFTRGQAVFYRLKAANITQAPLMAS